MKKQKIALFVRNGLVGHEGLNILVPKIKEIGFEPVIFNTGEILSKKGGIPELADLGFYETALLRDVVLPYLDARPLLLDENDLPVDGVQYSLQHLVQLYDLEYHDVSNVNDPAFIESIKADDRIVGGACVRILQIFKSEAIKAFKEKGFLWNLHTGVLPKYKGVHIPYRCLENGASEYGWTLHYVNEGVDTGDIIAVDSVPLDYKKSVFDTYLSMGEKGVGLILKELSNFKESGALPKARPQTEKEKESYYTFPTAQEMTKYDEMGIRFVDIQKVPDMYASKFSVLGTGHAQQLRMHVIEAIGDWERQKEELPAVRTKRSSAVG